MTNGTRLTSDTTTGDIHFNIKIFQHFSQLKRLTNKNSGSFKTEEYV